MLRMLFGEAPRIDEGELKDAWASMDHYLTLVRQQMAKSGDPDHDWRKVEVWAVGLQTSLDELEQSVYASGRFADRVTKLYQEEMSDIELDDYYRHVYFYKNGFIRVFSILDKLGTLLNEVLSLHTQKVKQHFSFFTVLRQMSYLHTAPVLLEQLTGIKETYKEEMQRLRKRRNMEIHHMNTEMQDDLWQRHRSLNDKVKLEDIQANMRDLQKSLTMVCQTIVYIFEHLCQVKARSTQP
ncbi:Cthe_2314 family HEPN domain-containing protein [Paenibacillus agilis]|uniref:Cthe-2314-like HEPN domain-containing protein n=1 Tax=Paenibacillus agilis TaxID=3020863 RepID=A0A559IHI5_9BACL|nr:Cthe_2314 family HEPN domain-containing protein [Paenibacillus agilis]TVX87104.1 hypothetical protein FPZ44_21660 [Paenibacillus agilis]